MAHHGVISGELAMDGKRAAYSAQACIVYNMR